MFSNYFRIALRSLLRHKVFTFINVVGLSIGISGALVIYLIVHYEFTFDKFHQDADRIYRVVTKMEFPDMTSRNPGVPVPTVKAAREELTGVELATHIITAYGPKVTVPSAVNGAPKVFKNQTEVIYTDPDYFKFFHYQWLAGSPSTALSAPFQVVLTERRAEAYFPGVSPNDILSKQLTYDDTIVTTVSGIVKDFDENTDFAFCEFISIKTVEQTGLKENWGWESWQSTNSSSQLFLKLLPGVSPKDVERQLATVRAKHVDPREKDYHTENFLQPLSDIHFDADYGTFDNRSQPNKSTLYGLLAVAAFLLLLGSINFINLATAQSLQKAKEIGIRKTLGSGKTRLIVQFLGESLILTAIAAVVSIAMAQGLLDIFRTFIPAGVTFASLMKAHVWIFLIILVLSVSILSGLYPAYVLSRFQPIAILRNQASGGGTAPRSTMVRKLLTVAQFTIAQFLIIATIVVSKQILFSLNADLGYRKDAIVWFRCPWTFSRGQWNAKMPEGDMRRFTLADRLKQIPEIERVSVSGAPPASSSTSTSDMKTDNGKNVLETMVEIRYADPEYFGLYGMKLVAGRNLVPSDTTREYVINETYAKFLGFENPADAIGHVVKSYANFPIVGVVADFHTKSMRAPIKPLVFANDPRRSYTIHLALNPRDPSSWNIALSKTKQAFNELYPDQDFDPKFFDESIAAFYKKEQNTSLLLNWAAGLAVFISCLGLLGLAIHSTNARTKEIGVRKVLGASATGIVTLLSREFISLVLIAFAISAPVGWWAMHDWLQDYAFRTTLSWWVFAITGCLAIVAALVTVCVQAIKAATANPVDSLRNE